MNERLDEHIEHCGLFTVHLVSFTFDFYVVVQSGYLKWFSKITNLLADFFVCV